MDAGWNLLIDLMAILAGAFLFGAVLERFRQPAVLGYILAGVLLGPGAIGIVQSVDAVSDLAEVGVALLLFSIGLEFSWSHVLTLGRVGLLGGSLQVGLTLAATFGIASALGLDPKSGLALGAIIALSSTVVVLKALKDQGDLDATFGRAATGVLILQDLAFVPLVVLISLLGSEIDPSRATPAGTLLAQAVLALIVLAMVVLAFVPRLFRSRSIARNRELPILLAITSCMGAAWLAHTAGLSAAIGAFLAGVLLSETPYAAQIRADVGPLKTVFATLFFASVGMLANPVWIKENFGLVVAITLSVGVGKAMVAFVAMRLVRVPRISAIATGLSLAQIGELSFVLLQLADNQGVLAPEWVKAATSASVLTLVCTPLVVGAAPEFARWWARRFVPVRKLAREEAEARRADEALHGHLVVVGFGEAGRAAAEDLHANGYDVLVLETDRKLLGAVEDLGCHALLGDATQRDILEDARLPRARGVVVAVSDHRTAALIVTEARQLAPSVPIIARARYHVFLNQIVKAGADQAVDEETLVGRRLAEVMTLHLGGLWDHEGRE